MPAAATWARPAIEAVLNGVWQGILLVAIVALAMRLARRSNAATRYALWWTCLAAVLVLPLAGWVLRRMADGPWALAGVGFADGTADTPAFLLPGGHWPELLLVLWGLVSAALLLRVGRGYMAMKGLKDRSQPLTAHEEEIFRDLLRRYPSARPVRIRRSRELPSPITAGLADPMILLPAGLLRRLAPGELRQIVLHELTHVRRSDDRAILAQRMIEAVFFFHPAVRWVAGRLELEREIACDDRVVALTGERKAYARCLTHLAELGPVRAAALASGALLHRGHLVRRVTLLLDARRRVGERVSAVLLAGMLALLGGAVVWLGGMEPVIGVPDLPLEEASEVVQRERARPATEAPLPDLADAPIPTPAAPVVRVPRVSSAAPIEVLADPPDFGARALDESVARARGELASRPAAAEPEPASLPRTGPARRHPAVAAPLADALEPAESRSFASPAWAEAEIADQPAPETRLPQAAPAGAPVSIEEDSASARPVPASLGDHPIVEPAPDSLRS